MAGITSNVYDIFQPTPVPLKELSAIAVSLELWHYKMEEYRKNGKLKAFCPSSERILSKTILPDLPTTLYTTIDKYTRRFGLSMTCWLKEHHQRIFHINYDNQNAVLKCGNHFVCDYTGAIDYLRTARSMMYCGHLDRYMKYAIACTYFFENHIRGLWPLVSRNEGFSLRLFNFSKSPQLYYWTCCVTNQLDRIPSTGVMLNKFMPHNRPSIEYFWNRLPTENRMRRAFSIFKQDAPSFVRFILQKLDDQQLNRFVNENDCHELVTGLFKDAFYDEQWILSMWMRVQRVINVDRFIEVVEGMLQSEVRDPPEDDNDKRPNLKNWGDLCCEIWNRAPEEWKRKAVERITSNPLLFHGILINKGYNIPPDPKHLQLLPTFLSCATSEERRRFWLNCWQDLIKYTWGEDLSKIMNPCFENQVEIDEFKRNVMLHHHDIHSNCTALLKEGFFEEVNGFVSFLFSEQQPLRYFKQQLLQEVFFGGGNIIDFSEYFVRRGNRFVEFVDDAYADIDRSTEFKIQFMSSPEIQDTLSYSALIVAPEQFIEFMDSFALTEDTLLPIKTRIIELHKVAAVFVDKSWKSVLSWCSIYRDI